MDSDLLQWPGEAELVTIRIGQVEEPLTPFGVARGAVRTVAGRDHAGMQGVDVGMVEDDTSPPRPIPLGRLGDEIDVAGSSPKARKSGVITTVNDLKSQHAIEADGARHIMGGQRDGADALDHVYRRIVMAARISAFEIRTEARRGRCGFARFPARRARVRIWRRCPRSGYRQ